MYKISKKLLIANSLLALSIVTPYDCHSADSWKKFITWDAGSSSEDEMTFDAQTPQTPQRTPRFYSQIAHNFYQNQQNEESSIDFSDEAHSSGDEEMTNETETIQTQPQIQIPGIIPNETPKKRNHEVALESPTDQSQPQKTFGMKRPRPLQLALPQLSPAEEKKKMKLQALRLQQEMDEMSFENTEQKQKLHFLTKHTENEKKALLEEYNEDVKQLQLKLAKQQQSLENELVRKYGYLELNQHTKKVKLNLLKNEQEKNILFEELFLGTDDDIHFGLPLDIWGVIFDHFCQGKGCRFNFPLISRKFNHIAKVFTHKIKIPSRITLNVGSEEFVELEPSLSEVSYIFANFQNCNQITVLNDKLPLLDILKLAPNLNCLNLTNALFSAEDDYSTLLTNLKSLKLSNKFLLPLSFKEKTATIEELSLLVRPGPQSSSFTTDEFKKLTNLKSLNVSNNQLTDEILSELTNLTCLIISRPFNAGFNLNVTDNSLKLLTNLVRLELPEDYNLNVETYSLLTKLQSLNGISVSSDRIEADNLGNIYIIPLPVTDIKLIADKAFSINTTPTNRGHMGTGFMAPMGFFSPSITEIGTYDSLDKSNIETLDISDSKHIKNKHFEDLINLKTLHLGSGKMLTDKCFKPLKNLTALYLEGNTRISDNAFKCLPNLKVLTLAHVNPKDKLDGFNVTDKGLMNLTHLTSLDLNKNSGITNHGIQNLTGLTKLSLGTNQFVTDAGIRLLTNLTVLDLGSNTNITMEGVKNMSKLLEITHPQN